ncbi:hypothetical protein Trydic_g11373 [Trypoxylus dichotomus]
MPLQHNKVQEYKESLKGKAEELVFKGFPETIVQLNEILETPSFKNRAFVDVHQDLNIPVPDPILVNSHDDLPPAKKTKYDNSISQEGTKVMALPNGTSPSNKHIQDLVGIVKPHIRKLVEDSNLLKMWISFMIPKIEDGNNFGVSIQEDTLAEVQSVESEAAAFFDQISRYFISRGKLVSKVAKYPHIDDYRQAVVELDEKEYLSLWLVMAEIRFQTYCGNHKLQALGDNKVQEYIQSLKIKAEELIFNRFPEKIVELNNTVESANFKNKLNTDVHQDLNTPVPIRALNNTDGLPPPKRLKYTNSKISSENTLENADDAKLVFGLVPTNKHILDLAVAVKPHIRSLIEDANLLKMWITVMIPKIEDGNNFGVSIQTGTLAEIQSIETGTSAFLDQISKYYVARGKLVSKVRKYPHVDDYRHAVKELDEKEYLSLCLMMVEIRNHYCSLHDIVTKNFDKIKTPRVTNASESFC